jgi:hypothetical protein
MDFKRRCIHVKGEVDVLFNDATAMLQEGREKEVLSIESKDLIAEEEKIFPVGEIINLKIRCSDWGSAYNLIHLRYFPIQGKERLVWANQFKRKTQDKVYTIEAMNLGDSPIHIQKGEKLGEVVSVPLEQEETPLIPLDELTTKEEFDQNIKPQIRHGQDKEMTEHHHSILYNVLWLMRASFPCRKRAIGYSWYHLGVRFETQGKEPPYHGRRRYSLLETKAQNDYVTGAYELNLIEPSSSPMNYHFVLVPKKDPTEPPRVTHNYKPLNEITEKDSYPMWYTEDILQGIPSNTRHFSAIDAVKGFLQIPIRDLSERKKTAFSTELGHHQYRRCPMGVKNGVSIYQRDMNLRYQDYIRDFVFPFVDDLLIFSSSPMEHLWHIGLVCNRMIRDGMCLSHKKSYFFKQEVKCLGHIVSKEGIRPDPEKIQAVNNWPMPRNQKDVLRFLGLTNFYRKFVKDYARIVAPLRSLTAQDTTKEAFDTPQVQAAFKELKECLCKSPILRSPNLTQPFKLYTDASADGYSCILAQDDETGNEYVVAYYSKATTPYEAVRHSTELEFGAVNWALEKCRPIIYGSKITIITDHSALKSLLEMKTKNRRIQAMSLDLEEWRDYITIQHRAGKINHADGLSRVSSKQEDAQCSQASLEHRVYNVQSQNNSENVRIGVKLTISEEFRKELQDSYELEEIWKEIVHKSRDEHVILSHKAQAAAPHYKVIDGLLYWIGNIHTTPRLCIPKACRPKIYELVHHHPFSGHLGRERTLHRAQEYYFWPHMNKDIRKHVENCLECQQSKSSTDKREAMRQPLDIPSRRWGSISMDFMTGFPGEFDCMWVVVDRLTKRIRLFAIKSTITALELAKMFVDEIVKIHGLPDELVCDRDSKFRSEFWKAFMQAIQTDLCKSTAFHPQTDGQTERMNRTVLEMLRSIVLHSKNPEQWHAILAMLEFAYNSSINSATGYSPFYADLGWNPKDLHCVVNQAASMSHVQEVENWKEQVDTVLTSVQDALAVAQQKQIYDQGHTTTVQWNIGDYAWIETKDLNIPIFKEVYKKLRPKFIGPFKVLKKINDAVLGLDLPEHFKVHPNFNVKRLKKSKGDENVLSDIRPPSVDVQEGEEPEYEIEKLIAHRRVRNSWQFLVKWLNYPEWEATWVSRKELLRNAGNILAEYEDEHMVEDNHIPK